MQDEDKLESMTLYYVNEVYPALQGEGVQQGTPMVILRLQGCAVGCRFCDTKYTWRLNPHFQVHTIEEASLLRPSFCSATAQAIVQYITGKYVQFHWVLLTGGEPSEQDLKPLVSCLQRAGYKVALETSGTALGHIHADLDWICVSPKLGNPAGLPVLQDAVLPADEIKFLIASWQDVEKLQRFLEAYTLTPGAQVCVQPISQEKQATEICVDAAYSYGWRVSLQMHKYIGMA